MRSIPEKQRHRQEFFSARIGPLNRRYRSPFQAIRRQFPLHGRRSFWAKAGSLRGRLGWESRSNEKVDSKPQDKPSLRLTPPKKLAYEKHPMSWARHAEQSRDHQGAVGAYTAIAQDASGDLSTNSSTVYAIPTNGLYAYDSNGNLTTDGYKNFTYDDENELIAVWLTNAWSNSFAYDGKMRRRIERQYTYLPSSSSYLLTNEVHFIYDGNVVIEERSAANVSLVSYTRGNDLSGTLQGAGGIGGLLARTTYGQELPGAPTTAFYHADGNGNITALLYPNQQLAGKYLYDPFGNMLAMSGPLMNFNKYRFSSKEWTDNCGLYYYLYRFYDPGLQRWPNRDPTLEVGFDALTAPPEIDFIFTGSIGLNRYGFVAGDPVDNLDLVGLSVYFTRPCSAAEQAACELECAPTGAKSCTVTEEWEHVPGKPPQLKSSTKNCTCKDKKPPSWDRCFRLLPPFFPVLD
jgi:RHS repeat-associated protein